MFEKSELGSGGSNMKVKRLKAIPGLSAMGQIARHMGVSLSCASQVREMLVENAKRSGLKGLWIPVALEIETGDCGKLRVGFMVLSGGEIGTRDVRDGAALWKLCCETVAERNGAGGNVKTAHALRLAARRMNWVDQVAGYTEISVEEVA